MSETTKNNPLGTERVGSLMVKFAVPSIIAMLVGALYNIVDQLFIGQAVGTLGNAATNIAFPLSTSREKTAECREQMCSEYHGAWHGVLL